MIAGAPPVVTKDLLSLCIGGEAQSSCILLLLRSAGSPGSSCRQQAVVTCDRSIQVGVRSLGSTVRRSFRLSAPDATLGRLLASFSGSRRRYRSKASGLVTCAHWACTQVLQIEMFANTSMPAPGHGGQSSRNQQCCRLKS